MSWKALVVSGVVSVAVLGALAGLIAAEERGCENSVTVVYNHEGSAAAEGLHKRGGFSAYVQLGESSVLFDFGGEAGMILENLTQIGADLAALDAAMISHNHWDHVYGLPGVMGGNRTRAPVYVPAPAAAGIKQQFPSADVIPVEGPLEIAPGIWITRPLEIEFLGARLSEQALVLEHPDGLHIIAGCSHPGIVAMVESAKEMFPETPVALVAGGFHLRSTGERELRQVADALWRLGVRKIGPSHCSGDAAKRIFRERWAENFVSFDLGDVYRF